MVREDILTGLRNALERGYSLEQAQRTLFNSGYSAKDINEATRYLAGGLDTKQISNYVKPPIQAPVESTKPALQNSDSEKPSQINGQNIQRAYQPLPQNYLSQNINKQKPAKSKGGFWILFVILIFLLISLIGLFITLILQKDKVISLLQSLFS